MERLRERPPVLYHGTNRLIHSSDRPFIDPWKAGGTRDEGEPKESFIMATPHQSTADLFAVKTRDVKVIFHDIPQPAIIFDGLYLPTKLAGFSYELPSEGFQQVIRQGKPVDKWYKLATDMEEVIPGVRGIPLKNAPFKRVYLQSLITEHNVRIYWKHADYIPSVDIFRRRVRDAINSGEENAFLEEGVTEGWLNNMTEKLKERITSQRPNNVVST